jgi:hypothetical protein
MERKDKSIIGTTGEYYVAAKLSSFGLTVAMTNKNTPEFDILATDGKKQKLIQVKTTPGPNADWTFSEMVIPKPNVVYVLVILKPKKDCDCPDFYIVPGAPIRQHQEEGYAVYVENYKKQHGKNPDSSKKVVHKFKDKERKFLNKWKLLGLELNNTF